VEVVVVVVVVVLTHLKGREDSTCHISRQAIIEVMKRSSTTTASPEVVGEALVILTIDDSVSVTDEVVEGEKGVVPLGRAITTGEWAHRCRYL